MLQINALSRKLAKHKLAIDDAFQRVLASGWLVLGPEVGRFEKAFAAYVGAGHCVGVANGTDAIQIALRAMGIGSGDQVATVANASMYTTTALQQIGAVPHFMDVDADTHGATLGEVQRAIRAGVKAVVVTHLYGLAVPETAAIAQVCAQHGVPLLEDCAQAHGATLDGRRVGSFGTAASFSFYPTKNLGALGDGGAVVTSDNALAERVRVLRQYGWTSKYQVDVSGACNSRLDEVQAAFLSEFLTHLDADNDRRRQVATRYSVAITNPHIILPVAQGAAYVAHLYVVRSKNREGLRAHLKQQGIGSDVHYPIPDHRQPLFGNTFAQVTLPVTEQLAGEVLTLPCYPEITDDEVQTVIDAVNGWVP